MRGIGGVIRRRVFRIAPEETRYDRRGFRGGENGVRERVEQIGSTFVLGYDAAMGDGRLEVLIPRLEGVEETFRGFAYEGAAMGLYLLDRVTPWNRGRFESFLAGPGNAHLYMAYVGAGWVWGRLPLDLEKARRGMDPLLGWLAYDGLGFHEGFFKWKEYLGNGRYPSKVRGYGRHTFDQGLGRSLWFIDGGSPARIARTIDGFDKGRRSDLWSGVGLACAYAGVMEEEGFRALLRSAGDYLPELAQGVAFAAKARLRAGNVFGNTERACRVICGLSAAEAARVTDEALENLPGDGLAPAYEVWRQRIQTVFRRVGQRAVASSGK